LGHSTVYAVGQQWRRIERAAHSSALDDSAQDEGRVELASATVELRSICENRRRATTVMGADAARELSQRLADLAALATVADLADLFLAATAQNLRKLATLVPAAPPIPA